VKHFSVIPKAIPKVISVIIKGKESDPINMAASTLANASAIKLPTLKNALADDVTLPSLRCSPGW